MYPRIVISLGLFLLQPVSAQEGVCWGVDGKQWTNNKQCPGSSACCGEDATCMPNRLCKNKGQGQNEFVRGPCAVAPYDKKKCAAICVFEEKNNRFPRVKRCEDGSYCCDDDPGCCAGKRGTFLDSKGNLEEDEDSTTTSSAETKSSSTTSAASTTTSAASTTTSTEPSATSDDSDEANADTADNSQGMKIGLGVGIPAAAIIAALSVWIFLKRRSSNHHDQGSTASYSMAQHYSGSGQSEFSQTQMYHQQYPAEMPSQSDTKSAQTVQELQG